MKKLLAILLVLQLSGMLSILVTAAEAVTIYADNALGGNCTSNNYSIAARNCSGSDGNAYTTIKGATDAVGYGAGAGANDIVEVRAGTYTPTAPIGGNASDEFPSGTSWGAPFILRARSGELVTVKANGAERNLWISNGADMYAIIDGFTFDGTDISNDQLRIGTSTTTARFVRIINNRFINTEKENAIYIGAPQAGQDDGIEIIDNEITGGAFFTTANAAGRNHAMYLTGRGTLIEGNHIHNVTGFAVHIFCSGTGADACSNHVVRKNNIHNFGTDTTSVAGILSLPDGGGANEIYNNKVYKAVGKTNDGASGISILGAGDKAYGNTIHSMTWMGIESNAASQEVKNNIIDSIPGAADQIIGSATRATNLCSQAHANCNVIGDPLFVNTATDDYSLQTGSPAKDAGTDLGSPYNVDFAGNTRPQGTLWDIGAYEFTVVPVPSRRRIVIQF